MKKYIITLCMKICMFQYALELEPPKLINYKSFPMVYIHALRSIALFRKYVSTQILIIFIICLVHVICTFIKNGWMINIVKINSCIYFKQQFKGIIIVIVVLRCGFIPKSPTKINIFQGIFN